VPEISGQDIPIGLLGASGFALDLETNPAGIGDQGFLTLPLGDQCDPGGVGFGHCLRHTGLDRVRAEGKKTLGRPTVNPRVNRRR